MSDFSNDTANNMLKVGEKSVEAIIEMFKFLIERNEKKVNAKIQKQKLAELKLGKSERKSKVYLSKRIGEVNAKHLINSGEPLAPLGIRLNDEQLIKFAEYAKKYGVIFASVSDSREEGEKLHAVLVKQKDLPIIKLITDRLTEDMELKRINDRLSELEAKDPEDLTEEEIAEMEDLKQQKEDVFHRGTAAFNSENADILFNELCDQMETRSLSFEHALNRFTDRDFSRNTPYYICERTNPNSHIEMISTYDNFRGKEYTKTDYRVFKEGEEQFPDKSIRADGKFTDERFEGRPKYYWYDVRNNMKAKGGFSDDVIIFNTKEEFERYQSLYKQKLEKSEIKEQVSEHRDYQSVIKQLKVQLDDKNAVLSSDGKPVDLATGELMVENLTDLSKDEKIRVSECVVIAKQIKNYNQLAEMEVKLAIAKQTLDTMNSNPNTMPNVKMQLESDIEQYECDYLVLTNRESELEHDRKQVCGIYAENEVDKAYEMVREDEEHEFDPDASFDIGETKSMESWKQEIAEMRSESNGDNVEHVTEIVKATSLRDER